MAGKKKPQKIKKMLIKKHKNKINYEKRAAFIRIYDKLSSSKKKNFNANQKREITKKYNHLKQYSGITPVKVTKRELKEYKDRGYPTTPKGVIVDQLRDNQGRRIKNSRVRLLNDGVIKETVNKRTAYIINLTANEREQFLIDPKAVILEYLKTPTLKRNFNINKLNDGSDQYISMQFGHMAGKESRTVDGWNDYFSTMDDLRFAQYTEYLTGFRITKW